VIFIKNNVLFVLIKYLIFYWTLVATEVYVGDVYLST